MIYYVIPSRRNSKGLLFKNRFLLDYTINQISDENFKNTIVSTDDEVIIDKLKDTNIKVIKRLLKLSKDDVSIKKVMLDVIDKCSMVNNDVIVLLYLVYPMRINKDIEAIISFYRKNNAKSLLCCHKVTDHPCLTFYAKDNFRGEQIIKHNAYRRQDYPECFSLSHFVCIFKVSEIDNLNANLYNKDTIFYPIEKPIDIDTKEDLVVLKRKEERGKRKEER